MGMVLGMSARSPSPVDFTQPWLGTQMSLAKMSEELGHCSPGMLGQMGQDCGLSRVRV